MRIDTTGAVRLNKAETKAVKNGGDIDMIAVREMLKKQVAQYDAETKAFAELVEETGPRKYKAALVTTKR